MTSLESSTASRLRWLALVPAALFLGLGVWAAVDQRWWSAAKHLLLTLFFVTVPLWAGGGRRAS